MLDLIVRNASLPDGRTGMDIAVKDGTIEALDRAIDAAADKEIDAGGNLVTPPFVDSHFHLDAALSYGLPRANRSGTLLEGIELWGGTQAASDRGGHPGARRQTVPLGHCPGHPGHPQSCGRL